MWPSTRMLGELVFLLCGERTHCLAEVTDIKGPYGVEVQFLDGLVDQLDTSTLRPFK